MAAGYDYVVFGGSEFSFPLGQVETLATRSLNQGTVIHDRPGFEAYQWPDPDAFDYSRLDCAAALLPPGMKVIVPGPCGVLENVTALVGYENLCAMLHEDPLLAADIFEAVGSRLLRYYELCAFYPTVGALIGNDDWGFKSQTMLSPTQMRRYVFPWYRRIVQVIHDAGKPAILHSCGCLAAVMEDIIEDMRFDARHSYEDAIEPVEEAYERWGARLAILGGIDVDFIVRSAPEDITRRSRAILERSAARGGYALGTGNSVPEYVPDEHYFAMIRAALET
jgi:uroporphyrinogen decarboxylase